MLDGITVLSETTQWTAGVGTILSLIVFFGLTVLCLIGIISMLLSKETDGIGFFIMVFIICGLISLGCAYSYSNRTSYKEYKVTISDLVKMTEFNNRYEIIDQEGKIFTIRDKEK